MEGQFEVTKNSLPSPINPTAGNVCFLPIQSLRTTYKSLRPGAVHRRSNDTAELPLRVAPIDDGFYEVIDGFKRLDYWQEHGHELIPVVLERPSPSVEHKRLLLVANQPARTITALDEAKVVYSMMKKDGLTQKSIARQLRKKPQWVARRVDMATLLSQTAENKLAAGKIGPTLAHALCPLSTKDQDGLLCAIENHGLKLQEALMLVSAYRVADETDRRALLKAPLEHVRPEPAHSQTISDSTTVLEKRLEHIHEELVSFAEFNIPDKLVPAEKRRLEALHRSVLSQLRQTLRALGIEHEDSNFTGDNHDRKHERNQSCSESCPSTKAGQTESRDPAAEPRRDCAASHLLWNKADCSESGSVQKDRSPCSQRGGMQQQHQQGKKPEQARPLPGGDQAQGGERTEYHPDPERAPRAGILGGQGHSCQSCSKLEGNEISFIQQNH